MHSPAMVIITNHILELQAEASNARLAKQAKSARGESRGPIAGALATFRSLLGGPAESPLGLPKLTDYPYRS